MKRKLETKRTRKEHRYSRYQVVEVLSALTVWDDHHREERHQGREQRAKDENYESRAFEVTELGGGNFPVDLSQAFLTTHCEQRMAKSNKDRHNGDSRGRRAS